jgi:DNA-directed RNA polymerase specialized sigma24 family protein/CheY-like chemotaxis protein
MSLKSALGPELPFLRRYARALTGSQPLGDAAVRLTLESILESPDAIAAGEPVRQELYRYFHKVWRDTSGVAAELCLVSFLPVPARQALLLTAVEGFSASETAIILDRSVAEVEIDMMAARAAINEGLRSDVMIIEDESIIALHIKTIVEDLGHNVVGIARTRTEAFTMASETRPDLVLADISLADGSSGIDAVTDILAMIDVPAIFVTAFPERLLTGERPEPTYLISKPFEPEMITATIGQALLFHREIKARDSVPTAAAIETAAAVPNPRSSFDSPEALLADAELGDDQKHALLTDWDAELDARLNAESEGMGASDPMTARTEARLADEATHVKSALTDVSEKRPKP